MKNISIYINHGASVCVDIDGDYRILEWERFNKVRYSGMRSQSMEKFRINIRNMLSILKDEYNIDNNFDSCALQGASEGEQEDYSRFERVIREVINADRFILKNHHESHAACAFYQSPFKEALIISFDGSGNDGKFNIYEGSYEHGIIPIKKIDKSLGKIYREVSLTLSDIKKLDGDEYRKMVSFAGKLMGLSAYGNIREEWKDPFYKFYNTGNVKYITSGVGKKFINQSTFKEYARFNQGEMFYEEHDGQFAYDIARTNQYTFEEYFLDLTFEIIKKYKNIVLTGGCALNVLLNERLRKVFGNKIFIPPNPDDSGIGLGQLFLLSPPEKQVACTYNGFPILDKEYEEEIIKTHRYENISTERIVRLLKEGKIGGIIRGDSEIGPRALGHRSIIADPSFKNMRDKINKIKNREWFRPFAPAVRYEERDRYFKFNHNSPFMSYAPEVREEYRNTFPSITHVDGTARLQTVKEDECKLFYDILGEVKVLLNTSFNINGASIITMYKDAEYILDNTSLDFIVTNNYIVFSK